MKKSIKTKMYHFMAGWADAAGMRGFKLDNDPDYLAGWDAGKRSRKAARQRIEKRYGMKFDYLTLEA